MVTFTSAPVKIVKGVNDCFFVYEGTCQHVEKHLKGCPNIQCECYKPAFKRKN